MSAGSFDNPYQSSSEKFANSAPTLPRGDIQSSCKSIAFWQAFFAILLAVGTVIMLVVFALQTVLVAGGGAGGVIGSIVGLAVVVGVMILFYVIPAILLWKASAASRAVAQGQVPNLDEMLSRQKSFWRYVGIATIVVVGFYVFIVLIAIVVGLGTSSFR